MYPFLVPCFVMGVVTPDQLITNISFQDLPFAYKKAQHRDYYTKLSVNTHDFYLMQMVILVLFFLSSLLFNGSRSSLRYTNMSTFFLTTDNLYEQQVLIKLGYPFQRVYAELCLDLLGVRAKKRLTW